MTTEIISELINSPEFSNVLEKVRNAFLSPYMLWTVTTIGMVIFLQIINTTLLMIILRSSLKQ
jgi:hypothetical protein